MKFQKVCQIICSRTCFCPGSDASKGFVKPPLHAKAAPQADWDIRHKMKSFPRTISSAHLVKFRPRVWYPAIPARTKRQECVSKDTLF